MAQFIEIVMDDEKFAYRNGDSTIFYRRFDQAIVSRIQKKWTSPDGVNRRTGEKRTKLNNEEWYADMLDYIIVGWDNIMYPAGSAQAGKAVECTRETKCKLPARIREEIWELAESEGTLDPEEKEAQKKISETTSSM